MKILFICGVSDAGKSTTIRHSIKFLDVDASVKEKFQRIPYRNPPKTIKVKDKTVCVYLDSPQEIASDPEEAVEYLRDKIRFAQNKNADLLVLAFNVHSVHDSKTDACLHWLDSNGPKQYSYFTYLYSGTTEDSTAQVRMQKMKNDGFNILLSIDRINADEQGKKFAQYIKDLLR